MDEEILFNSFDGVYFVTEFFAFLYYSRIVPTPLSSSSNVEAAVELIAVFIVVTKVSA